MTSGALLVLSLLTALVVGVVAWLTLGAAAALFGVVLLIGVGTFGVWFATELIRRTVLGGTLALLLATLAFAGVSTASLISGLGTTSGSAEAAEPEALGRARLKLQEAQQETAVRLEFTEEELTALVQAGLASNETPVQSIRLDFVSGSDGAPGTVRFDVRFKSAGLTGRGEIGYALEGGDLKPQVRSIDLGLVSVPPTLRAAIDELVEQSGDLNATLREHKITVQQLEISDTTMVLIGTQGDGPFLSPEFVIAQFAGVARGSTTPHMLKEVLGPGMADTLSVAGSPVLVALGDSLAANVGVASPREGYVSRFHAAVRPRDDRSLGLRNFAIPGETSSTLRRGQLDEALRYMREHDVAYVTMDIGANDLLPHLGARDCQNITNPACQQRLKAALDAYRTNLDHIFGRIREAAPRAQILMLGTYNPFSFGTDLSFERDTDDAVDKLNAVASEVARRHGAQIADGAAAIKGLAGVVTHMSDPEPDIHPTSLGYDLLASALLAVTPQSAMANLYGTPLPRPSATPTPTATRTPPFLGGAEFRVNAMTGTREERPRANTARSSSKDGRVVASWDYTRRDRFTLSVRGRIDRSVMLGLSGPIEVAVSPTGEWVAYFYLRHGTPAVKRTTNDTEVRDFVLMNTETGEARTIASDIGTSRATHEAIPPRWSPSGRFVQFANREYRRPGIAEADSGGVHFLEPNATVAVTMGTVPFSTSTQWLPDTDLLLRLTSNGSARSAEVLDPESRTMTPLTVNESAAGRWQIYPLGLGLLFESAAPSNSDSCGCLAVIDLITGTTLTPQAGLKLRFERAGRPAIWRGEPWNCGGTVVLHEASPNEECLQSIPPRFWAVPDAGGVAALSADGTRLAYIRSSETNLPTAWPADSRRATYELVVRELATKVESVVTSFVAGTSYCRTQIEWTEGDSRIDVVFDVDCSL